MDDSAQANFDRWFAGSTVVDVAGAPLVVYHGTDRDFDQFYTGRAGAHFGSAEQANYRIDKAREGARLMPVYLSIQNPVRLPDLGSWGSAETARSLASKKIISEKSAAAIVKMLEGGFGGVVAWTALKETLALKKIDGIVYANTQEGEGDSWIAFHPEQIKSSTENLGAYAVDNPDFTDRRAVSAQQALDWLANATKKAAPHVQR